MLIWILMSITHLFHSESANWCVYVKYLCSDQEVIQIISVYMFEPQSEPDSDEEHVKLASEERGREEGEEKEKEKKKEEENYMKNKEEQKGEERRRRTTRK